MKSLVISEFHNIAAVMEDGKSQDFFISRDEFGVGDIHTVQVENIMSSINAVFVKLDEGKMGFLHANDIPGTGTLHERLSPGQKLMVQIEKEPTGKKGPRVNLAISIPGRYYVLTTETDSISISKKISENSERDRLKSITNLMKPESLGLVIRTEAEGRSQEELEEDFVNLWNIWKNINDKHENRTAPGLVYKDKDFLYSVLRDNFNSSVDQIIVSSVQSKYRCEEFLKTWTGRQVEIVYIEPEQMLQKSDIEKELKSCLSRRADLPSGGYIIIQTMEALTAIDINSGKFTTSNTLRETVRRTNMEAAIEIARQVRLRNIGGMIIVDFIDMGDRMDRISVMETLESAFRSDKAKPQIGNLSDLCLVEITRKRSGQALSEVFGEECNHCGGTGIILRLDNKSSKDSSNNRNQSRNKNYNSNTRSSNSKYSNNKNSSNSNKRDRDRDRGSNNRRQDSRDDRRSNNQDNNDNEASLSDMLKTAKLEHKSDNYSDSSNNSKNDYKNDLTSQKTFANYQVVDEPPSTDA
jgi:ribonuclease E